MVIKTVRDYLESNKKRGLEYCFKSSINITDYGTTIYSIVVESSSDDAYLHVRPLDGRLSAKERAKKGLPETIHIPKRQHLDDTISNIPPQKA